MLSTLILHRTTKPSPLLFSLLWSRSMGGGPRTFPGGLNKWQWKRLHEKKARDKESRLLNQEKQLYQARLRTQIRASFSGQQPELQSDGPGPTHSPMSTKDHIKALADRFMRPGAEDLWNDDDGPVTMKPDPGVQLGRPMREGGTGVYSNLQQKRGFSSNLRSFTWNVSNLSGFCSNSQQERGFSCNAGLACGRIGGGNLGNLSNLRYCTSNLSILSGFCSNLHKERGYSANPKVKFKPRFKKRSNGSSSSDDDDFGEDDSNGMVTENARWPRLSVGGRGTERDEKGEREGGKNVRGFMGNTALGKYDVKFTKKRILKELEDYADQEAEEGDLGERIEQIRREFNARKLEEKEKPEVKVEQKRDEFIATKKSFQDCVISPLTVKALTSAGYVLMTPVQEATFSICLEGKDALVKASFGTGKTAAFLLPAIETVLKAMSNANAKVQRVPPIYVLILCPTRELASQIAAEARVMLKYHDGLGVQMLVGGSRFKDDIKRLESDPCQILVATPGRLLDHVEARSGVSVRLMGLKMLIVDEADHLLDLGFRKDMEKIVDCLPSRRHSLLFSATIPKEVRRISQLVLKREHDFINTVDADAGCLETSSKVKQSYIITPHDLHFQIVHQLLKKHISQIPDYKVIVFCATGMVTSLIYMVLRELKLNVREIHTRKPQLYRSRIADEFKQSKRMILISSDASARGMDYPDVTLVVQMGVPPDRDQYMRLVGRTGSEGKHGEAILLIAPWEEYFLDDIRDLPIERSSAPLLNEDMKVKMEDTMAKIDTSLKEAAYHAWLGYYNSMKETGRDKTSLVKWANEFGDSIGLQNPPALLRKTAIKMGLKDIAGIRIRK